MATAVMREHRSIVRPPVDTGPVVDILKQYYRHVVPITTYLATLIPNFSHEEINDIFLCAKEYPIGVQERLSCLGRSLIAINASPDRLVVIEKSSLRGEGSSSTPQQTMDELIQCIQSRMIKRTRRQYGVNMLTMGMRRADERANVVSMIGQTAIEELHVNQGVAQLVTGVEWQLLLSKLGERVIEHLLESTTLFVPLSNSASSNYIQVLGEHLSHIKRLPSSHDHQQKEEPGVVGGATQTRKRRRNKRTSEHDLNPQNKRQRTAPINDTPGNRTPANVDLLRSRIFYAKPFHNRNKKLVTGLPPKHVFARSRAFVSRTCSSPSQNQASTQFERARLVSKYIWPKEYKLRNVWSDPSIVSERDFSVRASFAQRDAEIDGKSSQKTPGRLKKALPLINVLLRKHGRFDYRRALDLCCPSTLPKRKLTSDEREMIIDTLCEVGATQAQLATQQIQSQRYAKDGKTMITEEKKARFTRYKTAPGCVARFVRLVLRSIVPIELFGSLHNRQIIFRAIDRFVCARRFESMNLHETMQGFRLLDCHWLLPVSKRALQQRPTRAEMQKRQWLVRELLFWLFDGLVVPLLRTNFYATESAKFRHRVLYFLQRDWQTITQPIMESLKRECFEHLEKHKAVGIMSRREFGYSFVRLLPKEVGVRPIVNLRRRSVKIDRKAPKSNLRNADQRAQRDQEWGGVKRQDQSINSILGASFHVLKYEKEAHPSILGSSILGPQDVREHLSAYKTRLHSQYGANLPPLFFVKVDVAGAFDCIDQAKLLSIIDEIIRHDRYIVQRCVRLSAHAERAIRTWPRVACPEEEHEPFEEVAKQLTAKRGFYNSIMSDGVTHTMCERESLLWLVNEHVRNNLIKIGKDFCRQRVGIPQGSTLSTFMCCYYLACMERELNLTQTDDQSTSTKQDENLLMRYTDDFLFISTSEKCARTFFTAIHKGSERFNCTISPAKSRCNFNMVDVDVMDADMASIAAHVARDEFAGSTNDETFAWCGHRIDVRSLSVCNDWERHRGTCLADSLTLPTRRTFSGALSRVISTTVQRRNISLYLDVELNGIGGVLRNVHQSFVIGCLRLLAALSEVQKRLTRRGDKEYRLQLQATMMRYIVENVERCIAHAHSKMRRERDEMKDSADTTLRSSSSVWPVSEHSYRWLAFHGVHAIVNSRSHRTTPQLLEMLRVKLQQVEDRARSHRSTARMMHTLYRVAHVSLKESMHVVRTIK